MPKTNTCDVCGRTVTISNQRGEYVTGLRGYVFSDGSVRCAGNKYGPDGVCITSDEDGNTIGVTNNE